MFIKKDILVLLKLLMIKEVKRHQQIENGNLVVCNEKTLTFTDEVIVDCIVDGCSTGRELWISRQRSRKVAKPHNRGLRSCLEVELRCERLHKVACIEHVVDHGATTVHDE